MLPGFEDIKYDLTEKDIPVAELVAKGLNARIGKDNAITNKQIRTIFKEKYNIKISDPKFREMIVYIREHNLVFRLCACGKGYYKAQTDEEWEEWKLSSSIRGKKILYSVALGEFFDGGTEKL